jgi:hypothetical protein
MNPSKPRAAGRRPLAKSEDRIPEGRKLHSPAGGLILKETAVHLGLKKPKIIHEK